MEYVAQNANSMTTAMTAAGNFSCSGMLLVLDAILASILFVLLAVQNLLGFILISVTCRRVQDPTPAAA